MLRLSVLLMIFLSFLCAGKVTVAAAANTAYAMEEVAAIFKKLNPETEIDLIVGSSGKLAAQIKNGAPYDVFLSADMKYAQMLDKEGRAFSEPKVYAKGALVMFTVKDLDLKKGLMLLSDESINRIAVANYKLAPYGKAAVEAMKNAGVLPQAEKKFINAESITQTLQYTITAADIGFVAKSSMFSQKMRGQNEKGKNWIDVDPVLYEDINQGAILLKNGRESEEAKKFYDFIFSQRAKAVFKKYGYII